MTTYFDTMESPIGTLTLALEEDALVGVYMEQQSYVEEELGRDWVQSEPRLAEAREQFTRYFAGTMRDFQLKLKPVGTIFQERVWTALREIPFGETWSYGQLAKRVGDPNASRAVGLANGRNPLSIVIPCHRVIGANGTLTGYGGGIDRKKWLLEFESKVAGKVLTF